MRQVCDEVLIVHQSLFDSDREVAKSIGDKVEVVDWNFVFQSGGYGALPNRHGQSSCDWMLLLGTAETIAEQYKPIREVLRNSPRNMIWRANHHNDVNTWGRIFCPAGGVKFGGVIHEEAGGGSHGNVIFRMQDTEKTPHPDPFINESLKWMKVVSYHHNYVVLLNHPELLSYTNSGWKSFVAGCRESLEENEEKYKDLLVPARAGDREGFLAAVRARMEAEQMASGCNFQPLGEPMTQGA